MSYRNLIDRALEAAQARAHTPVETAKIASAPDALIKEAMDVAGALEFVSLSATGGDRAAGFREEMIREFYKTATAGNPASGPTAASGTQGIAPAAGKTKIAPKGLVGGNAPAQSTVSAATKDGDKAMLESFKQAGGQSLYDILMGNKTAAAGGPAEHDSETSAGVGTSNENSTYRKTLHSNEGPVNANRRDLKKSTRARLAEAFAHTGDTLGDATAAQIFPQAASRGSLKVADFRKEAVASKQRRARRAAEQERAAAGLPPEEPPPSKRSIKKALRRAEAAAAPAAAAAPPPAAQAKAQLPPQAEVLQRLAENRAARTAPTVTPKPSTDTPKGALQLPARRPMADKGPTDTPKPSSTKKSVSAAVKEAPSFLSRHKGKILAGGGAALLAAGGAGLYARNKGSSKTASREDAALAGAVHPFLATAVADEGRKKRTLAGGVAGQTMGGLAGLGLSALALRKHDPIALLGAGPMLGVGLSSAAGGALGSYLGHGKNITPQERMMRAKLDAELAAEAAKRGD